MYTQEKLYRYGLNDSPTCPRCNEIETLEHKMITCNYAERIWQETCERTKLLCPSLINETDTSKKVFAAVKGACSLAITIHAAILTRILYLKKDQIYLQHPKFIVRSEIKKLIKLERNQVLKQKLNDLLTIND